MADNEDLNYYYLNQFDREMNYWEEKIQWKVALHQYVSLKHEDDKIIVFEKGDLLFVFNFHPFKVSVLAKVLRAMKTTELALVGKATILFFLTRMSINSLAMTDCSKDTICNFL